MTTTRYKVSGLTCEGCVKSVQSLLENYAKAVEVTLTPPEPLLHGTQANIGTLNNVLRLLGDRF